VTGHPVDVATGKVFTDAVDFELPGPIPFRWERVWYSCSVYDGPLGHGWHHSYDMALREEDGAVVIRLADGRAAVFGALADGDAAFDRTEHLTLRRDHGRYSLTDRAGLVWSFAPTSPAGVQPLESIRNSGGNVIRFHHDPAGRMQGVTDSGGRPLHVEHDRHGRIVRLVAPHPDRQHETVCVVEYSYDALTGDLIAVTDAQAGRSRFMYADHLLVQETDRTGFSFHFEYDQTVQPPRCVHTWGDGGVYDHALHYDPIVGQTIVRDSLGCTATYHTDEAGRVVRTVDAAGTVTSTAYNEWSDRVAEVDGLGQATAREYTAAGDLAAIVRPDGSTITVEHEAGRPVRALDPAGGEWQWFYNDAGQLTKRIDPLGQETTYRFRDGWLYEMENPDGTVFGVGYDMAGNLVSMRGPDGDAFSWEYDRWGRRTVQADASGSRQVRRYDLLGRVVHMEDADGGSTRFTYNGEGALTSVRGPDVDIAMEYSGQGRLVRRTESGFSVVLAYDSEEQLRAIRNEAGATHEFELGPTGEVVAETDFDGARYAYERDALGRVTRLVRPGGGSTVYVYDPLGHVVELRHSDGVVEQFEYRADGEMIRAVNAAADVRLERDALGRVLREEQSGHWVNSRYGRGSLRSAVSSSTGFEMRIRRNGMGDPHDIVASEGGQARWTGSSDFDALGREVERRLPGDVVARWRRNDNGRTVEHSVAVAGRSQSRTSYAWSTAGRISEIIGEEGRVTRLGYGPLDHLAGLDQPDSTMQVRWPDAVGNVFRTRAQTDRQYGRSGQLLRAEGVRREYDADGNLIRRSLADGRTWQYSWNVGGRLTRVVKPNGESVHFEYDALGRRVRKSIGGRTTHFVWDEDRPLHEWVTNGPTANGAASGPTILGVVTWVFEPESFNPMARLDGNGAAHSILSDVAQRPAVVYDDRGDVVWRAGLDLYAGVRVDVGSRSAQPFRFAGQYEDSETGLYYNRFRYYDPEGGTYISRDPIGLGGGLRLYAYVPDPVRWADPFGRAKCGPKDGPLDWDAVVPKKGPYKGQARRDHVRLHNVDNPAKPQHGVFLEDGVAVTDEAWAKAGRDGLSPDAQGKLVVPMGRQVGWAGGSEGAAAAVPLDNVTIHVKPGTNEIITAYPSA
jgi:RHS repeat-associated protein